jgi:hypothetical protein
MAQTVDSPAPTLAAVSSSYFEDSVEINAGGYRMTLFVQFLPEKMTTNAQELAALDRMLRVYFAFRNFRDFRRWQL